MLNLKIFLFFLILAVFSSSLSSYSALGKPTEDEVSVELRDAGKALEGISFNHPYFIDEGRLRAILSSLYYREKGMLKTKTKKRIFLDKEIDAVVPLIVESLSKADPSKEVFASTTSERVLFRDKISTFSLFILGKELNIAFSQVQSTKEMSPNLKKGRSQNTKDPTSITSAGFWELVPVSGQRLKEGHENWLIINVEHTDFNLKPAVVAKEETITTSPLIEARLRRLEERAGLSPTEGGKQVEGATEQSDSATLPEKEDSSEKPLIERLRELKKLLNEELISPNDYEKKKLEMLQEETIEEKSIPDRLKELNALKDEALITEGDYERLKINLLKKL